jgi:hypothetical protein
MESINKPKYSRDWEGKSTDFFPLTRKPKLVSKSIAVDKSEITHSRLSFIKIMSSTLVERDIF